MSATVLFIILIVLGAVLVLSCKKIENNIKFIVMVIGIILICLGGYGIFTGLL